MPSNAAVALQARWRALPASGRGIVLIMLSGLCFSAMGALTKGLGQRLSYLEVAFFRSLLGWLLVWPFVVAAGLGALRTHRPLSHAVRGLASGVGLAAMFYGFVHLDLADATAYQFTRNLFIVVLAAVFLREPIRWDRTLVTLMGFAGVLVMLRPGGGGFSLAALIALGSALLAAGVIILIRQMMRSEAPVTVMFYFGVGTTLVTGLPAAWQGFSATSADLPLLLCISVLGSVGQSAMIRAYRLGDATLLAPFDYLQLIFATALGYLAFAELPRTTTFYGAGLIVAANLINTFRGLTSPAGLQPTAANRVSGS